MIKTISIYRSLIIVSIACVILWQNIIYIDHLWISDIEAEGLKYDTGGAIISFADWVWLLNDIIWVLLLFGLFFFKRIALIGFISLYIIIIVLNPFFGLSVQTGLQSSIAIIEGLVDGAIITMSLFTSISNEFKSRSKGRRKKLSE